jgi:peroxiredoxin
MTAQIGAPAPAFELRNTDKSPFSSDSLKGHKTLLVFIPFPFTGTCEDELCMLRDERVRLNDMDAQVVAISCDTPFANGAWAAQNGFEFPILSDFWPHGEVAKAYGAFNEMTGSANRFTFVLDADGIVRDIINTESLGVAREFEAYTEALTAI